MNYFEVFIINIGYFMCYLTMYWEISFHLFLIFKKWCECGHVKQVRALFLITECVVIQWKCQENRFPHKKTKLNSKQRTFQNICLWTISWFWCLNCTDSPCPNNKLYMFRHTLTYRKKLEILYEHRRVYLTNTPLAAGRVS